MGLANTSLRRHHHHHRRHGNRHTENNSPETNQEFITQQEPLPLVRASSRCFAPCDAVTRLVRRVKQLADQLQTLQDVVRKMSEEPGLGDHGKATYMIMLFAYNYNGLQGGQGGVLSLIFYLPGESIHLLWISRGNKIFFATTKKFLG